MAAIQEQKLWRLFSPFFKQYPGSCQRIRVGSNTTIVKDGVFQTNLQTYCAVPLMFIASGAVSIIDNGKAVKCYGKGDCLGLFETACFLQSGNVNRIGRWGVQATADTVLDVSTPGFLKYVPLDVQQTLIKVARDNPIAKPLSRLPLLDWIATTYGIQPQQDLLIAYHGHVLPSSQELIKHLAYVAGPENTFVLEKPYSTIPSAFSKVAEGGVRAYHVLIDPCMPYDYSVRRNVDYFWREIIEHVSANRIKKVVVISDGADVLLSPLIKELKGCDIVGIEQTARGLRRLKSTPLSFPVISIAESRAKKCYESPFIARAALDKMKTLGLIKPKLRYGVVGSGSIGGQVIRILGQEGIVPLVYDSTLFAPRGGRREPSLEALVDKSDIVIGTTGHDSLRGMFIERLHGRKTFVSTSSSNVEFAYLFNLAKMYSAMFEDVSLAITPSLTAHILNGGYPINFDRSFEWERPTDIQLTRGLLYASLYEALSKKHAPTVRSLQPTLETAVLKQWLSGKKVIAPSRG